jgi:DMSO/TMAO reductase YedYZ molybdopterin-dependent catalytic subunit
MSDKREIRQRAETDAIATEVLRHGTNTQRRSLFVSAAAFGAAAMTIPGASPASAQTAPAAAPAAAPPRRILVKDDSRVLNIGATVRSGNYWNFTTFMTPVEEFYVRNHYPTPTRRDSGPVLARENWKLKIHGASVERPVEISYNDLLGMPSRSIIATMECHGNGRTLFWEQGGFTGQQVAGGNWVLGAVGQAEWQYVPMSEIFARVGIKPDAKTVLFWSGVDGNDMGRPMPYADVAARSRRHRRLLRDERQSADARPWRAGPRRGARLGRHRLDQVGDGDPHHRQAGLVPAQHQGRGLYRPELFGAGIHAADDEFIGVTAADIKGPMVTWMPPKSLITVPLVLEKSPSVPSNYPLQRGEVPKLRPDGRRCAGYAWAPQHGVNAGRVPHRRRGLAAADDPPAESREVHLGPLRVPLGRDGRHPRDRDADDRQCTGVSQPEQIPLNSLGMANWSIPKFRIEVV